MFKPSDNHSTTISQSPAELLQTLIRFDTTNPPGNEADCVNYINSLLTSAGLETTLIGKNPARPNLISRIAGQGSAQALLLYGHVDVVTTENQVWRHSPFEGRLEDGYIWGRGALDMKGGLAMLLTAFLRAKVAGVTPPGDVILAVLCDEEQGGEYGAKYLVENHAAFFKDIRYAIGEFGGFTFYIGRQKFYPIMVAEKRACFLKATVRGPGGHASLPLRGGAIVHLTRLLRELEQRRLPPHITPVVRQMLMTLREVLPFPTNIALSQLANPVFTDKILNLMGARGKTFEPMLHNTVNVTSVCGGEQALGIPSEFVIKLAVSLLPGYGSADMIAELRQIIGKEVELEVMGEHEAGLNEPDMGLFGVLTGIIREADPDGTPVPLLMPSPTDGRTFDRLGIQTYGFLPMNLPADFSFSQTIHAADERVPVNALDFGTDAIFKALQRFESK